MGAGLGLLVTAIVVGPAALLMRRWPLAALTVLLACAVAETTAPGLWRVTALHPAAHILPSQPVLLVLLTGISAGFIAASQPGRVSVPAAMAAAGVLVGCAAARMRVPSGQIIDISPELTIVLTLAIAWLIGSSVRQSRRHAEALHAQAKARAVTAERLRIARELHDMVAHSIGIIAIQAGAGSRTSQPEQARQALVTIEATSRETLSGLRRMLVALRRGDEDGRQDRDRVSQVSDGQSPPEPAPGLADLDRLAESTANAGVRVEVTWHGPRGPLPADIDMSAFRIIQEAITNVVRHAGTDRCLVSVDRRDQELLIEITDDGRGCADPAPVRGFGIAGMRERAGLLHGSFTAGPGPDGGFRVAARLPLPVPAGIGLNR
ncbi:MAG TPA: sensor histidine kinase [Streptosporangiaceae bacterium]|nr:sensor histidine kinase [Streptosporangiaceae bacterium]